MTTTDDLADDLAADPDAVAVLTIDDLDGFADGEEPDASFSLLVDDAFGDDDLAYRYTAHVAAMFLGKHYPNETKHAGAKQAGGRFSASGNYMDPMVELDRRGGGDE